MPAPPTLPDERRKRRRRGCSLVAASAVALIAIPLILALPFENWRGRRDWEKAREQIRQSGEPIDPAEITPSPIPDAENFAAIPLFAPLFDYTIAQPTKEQPNPTAIWREPTAKEKLEQRDDFITAYKDFPAWRRGQLVDMAAWEKTLPAASESEAPAPRGRKLLALTDRYSGELAALRAAAARPHSRFPLHYDETYQIQVAHRLALRKFAQLLQLRVFAQLALGEAEAAKDDLLLGWRVADATRDEPLIVSQMLRVAEMELLLAPLWNGLERHQWSDAHLAEIERTLSQIDLLTGYRQAARGERVLFAWPSLEAMKTIGVGYLLPRDPKGDDAFLHQALRHFQPGWIDANKATIGRYYDRVTKTIDPAAHRVHAQQFDVIEGDADAEIYEHKFNPRLMLSAIMFTAFTKAEQRMTLVQSTLDLARCAIALERHHLATGTYPEKLDALAPRFLPVLPHELTTGDPLHYTREKGGNYYLYSVGWDATDDDGEPGETPDQPSNMPALSDGDWPWPGARKP